ncbi:MAG: hypothetical protein OXP66_01840 [Candidatus Tectomicrobia bacterium]|nr:hypothetical protein [Candidatus Tectomicrobia bacterium]
MKSVMFLMSVVLALTTIACSSGSSRMPLTEEVVEEGRIRFVRNTTYDGQVLTILGEDGGRPELTTARNAVDAGNPSRPAMPGHSGWAWTLFNFAQDSTTYAYAGVSWANDDPTDYLAAGYWIHYPSHPPDQATAEGAGFIDGPELDVTDPPLLPMQGQATYRGLAGGAYVYQYGDGWGEELAGAYGVGDYVGTVTLTADFAASTLSGCIGCEGDITLWRSQLRELLGGPAREIHALPTDYKLHLGAVPFNTEDGTFEHTDVTVTHPERGIAQSGGFWGGQFSNIPDSAGNPRLVAGFSDAQFEEVDGSLGSFWGMFNGVSRLWLEE